MLGELILATSMGLSAGHAEHMSTSAHLAAFAGTAQTTPLGGATIDGNRGNRQSGNRWNGGNQRGQTPQAKPNRGSSKGSARNSNRGTNRGNANQQQRPSGVQKSKQVEKSREINRSRDVSRNIQKQNNNGSKTVYKDINKSINKSKVVNKTKNVYKTKDYGHYGHGKGHGHGYHKKHYSNYYYNNGYRNWRGYNWNSWWNDCNDDFSVSINLNYDLTPSYGYTTSYYSYARPVVQYYPSPSTSYTSVYVTPGSAYDSSSYVYGSPTSDTDYRLYQQLLDEQNRLQDRVEELEDAPTTFVPVMPDYTTPVPQSELNSNVKPDAPRPIVLEGDILEPAWRTFASGDAAVAQRMFAMQAQSDEASAMDRIGFALAAAELGDIRTAAWSMRRALDENTAAIGFLPSDNAMQGKLNGLAGTLAETHAKALTPDHAADIATVAAVVSALRLDDEGVQRWATAAAEAGADADMVEQLRSLAGK